MYHLKSLVNRVLGSTAPENSSGSEAKASTSMALSEEFLLSLTKQSKLNNVKALDLSNRELTELDVGLLNKLPLLEILKVSDNSLTAIPDSIELRLLRKLDCSENEISNIEFVEKLTALRELNIDGNFLDASDRFIAVILCPGLEKLNGRDAENFKTFVRTKTAKLEEAIMELWEELYGDKYRDGLHEKDVRRITAELTENALKLSVDNNTPYDKLRTFMITRLCKELVQQVQCRNYQPLTPKPKKVSVKRLNEPKSRKMTVLKDRNRTPSKRTPLKPSTPLRINTPSRNTPVRSSRKSITFAKNSDDEGDDTPRKSSRKSGKVSYEEALSLSFEEEKGQSRGKVRSRKSLTFKEPVMSSSESESDSSNEENVVKRGRGRPKKSATFNKTPTKETPVKDSPMTKRKMSPKNSPQSERPNKRQRTQAADLTVLESPKKRAAVAVSSPRKSVAPSGKRRLSPDQSRSVERHVSKRQRSNKVEHLSELPPLPDYAPSHFLRCHFGDKGALRKGRGPNDPTDELTKIWWCAFEPHMATGGQRGCTTSTVATCGGNTVCLVDCGSGRVMKRFQQNKEHFFSLAWSTIPMEKDGRKWNTNILAVGGWNGHIRLLHPEQLVCYKELGNSGRPNKSVVEFYICCLLFHPTKPTLLFSGSSDSTVTLYDIGTPSAPNYEDVETKALCIFDSPSDILNLIVSPSLSLLVAGCEDGCYVWDSANTTQKLKRQKYCQELLLPKKEDWAVDGLTLIDEDLVASRSREDPCIYVWKLQPVSNKQNKVKVVPLLQLNWTNSPENFINLGAGNGLLGSGDHAGNVFLYNLSPLLKNNVAASGALTHSRVLQWPDLFINDKNEKDAKMKDIISMKDAIVNCVAISSSHEYVVTGTDHNVLCIWKRS